MNLVTFNHLTICLAVLLVTLASTLSAQAQTARAEILSATARLEKNLAALGLPEAEVKQRADVIAAARRAAEADRLYLCLYRLQPLWVEVMAQSYASSKKEVAKAGT